LLLWQSESEPHFLPFAHFGQFGPPQSVSDSPWSFVPSVQLTHFPFSQAPLWQSLFP
jgi:hypothetical protein